MRKLLTTLSILALIPVYSQAATVAVSVSPTGRVTEITDVKCANKSAFIIETEATGQRRTGCVVVANDKTITVLMDDEVAHTYFTTNFSIVRGKGPNVYQ